jgi:hypothetical protein
MTENRIPTHLWLEAEIRRLSGLGTGVYVIARGDSSGGMVLQKISDMAGQCRLLIQQRDFSGKLVWQNALEREIVTEADADAYIARARKRDPDLWVVEVEDREMKQILSYNSASSA